MVSTNLGVRRALLVAAAAAALGFSGVSTAHAGESGPGTVHADHPGPATAQVRQGAQQLQHTVAGLKAKASTKKASQAGAAPTSVLGDFNADGRADTLGRDSSGRLFLYAGTGNGESPFRNRVQVGTNWNIYTQLVRHGDWNADGHEDILAVDKSGVLWFYAGTAQGGLVSRVHVGSNWNIYNRLAGVDDYTGDGLDDLAAFDSSGDLYLYSGTGNAAAILNARVQIGRNWDIYNSRVSVGDLSGDGGAEILARDSAGTAWLYESSGNPASPLRARVQVGTGWDAFNLITATGDLDGGLPDLLVRDSAGFLYLLSSDRDYPDSTVGSGWNIYNAIF
jgi:hypothetical protein